MARRGQGAGARPAGRLAHGRAAQAHQNHYGVIYVESGVARFRQEDVDLLQRRGPGRRSPSTPRACSTSCCSSERLERDLRVARQIQRSLLPAKPPDVVGLDFAVHYEPAYQIGGDFYDFIWHDQSHLALAVGDVAGKAISAALYMARLTSELRSRAGIARTPARLLRRVNQEMLQLGDDGMFATLVYCIYDLDTRTLVFTNAGHCVPLLRRGDRVFPLHAERAHMAPIGVMPELEAGEARVQLHSGDMLILVSDGILEARDAHGNEYGIKRLSRRIRTARGGPEDVVKAILQDVDSHVASGSQGDDITIVAMGVGAKRARRRTDTIPGVAPGDPAAARGRRGFAEPHVRRRGLLDVHVRLLSLAGAANRGWRAVRDIPIRRRAPPGGEATRSRAKWRRRRRADPRRGSCNPRRHAVVSVSCSCSARPVCRGLRAGHGARAVANRPGRAGAAAHELVRMANHPRRHRAARRGRCHRGLGSVHRDPLSGPIVHGLHLRGRAALLSLSLRLGLSVAGGYLVGDECETLYGLDGGESHPTGCFAGAVTRPRGRLSGRAHRQHRRAGPLQGRAAEGSAGDAAPAARFLLGLGRPGAALLSGGGSGAAPRYDTAMQAGDEPITIRKLDRKTDRGRRRGDRHQLRDAHGVRRDRHGAPDRSRRVRAPRVDDQALLIGEVFAPWARVGCGLGERTRAQIRGFAARRVRGMARAPGAVVPRTSRRRGGAAVWGAPCSSRSRRTGGRSARTTSCSRPAT